MNMLITGGAGFVGSTLCAWFARRPGVKVDAFDNLSRAGASGNLERLKRLGVRFVHGDVRCPADFDALDDHYDVVIDAAADPSVHAGPAVIDTNLMGTVHLLRHFAGRMGVLVFLSTSRVYSIRDLRDLALRSEGERYVLDGDPNVPGVGPEGISEAFSTRGPRSLYGCSKLASEMLVEEFAAARGVRAIVDRCSVLCGPGQFGQQEQGTFAYWVGRHVFGRPLEYRGFEGRGHQVRDLLHPADLCQLIELQLDRPDSFAGEVFNVGGGPGNAVSLREYTALCREVTGRRVEIGSRPSTDPNDIPYYVTDNARIREASGWSPEKTVTDIVTDVHQWMHTHADELEPLFS